MIMKKNNKIFTHRLSFTVLFAILLSPVLSYAALGGLKGLLIDFASLLNQIIRVVFGLAVVFFFWGTGQFILHSDDEKSRNEGKQKMLWSVIALFVMASIVGIIYFIGGLLGISVAGPLPGIVVDCTIPGTC